MTLSPPLPDHVLNDLNRFIQGIYSEEPLNSLIIAQAFCMKHPDHLKDFGLNAIYDRVEHIIKNIRF